MVAVIWYSVSARFSPYYFMALFTQGKEASFMEFGANKSSPLLLQDTSPGTTPTSQG